MSSVLYNGRCLIKDKEYNVQISMEKNVIEECQSNEGENHLLKADNFQLKSNTDLVLIKFHLIDDRSTIPISLILNKILFLKQNEKSSGELIEIEMNYVHITEIFLWQVEQMNIQMDSISAMQFSSIINENLLKIVDRPRNLLVFVNPNCENNHSNRIYYEQI